MRELFLMVPIWCVLEALSFGGVLVWGAVVSSV